MSHHVREATLVHGRVRFVDEGQGPVLLLLHGLGGNWQSWQANIGGLARRHRVIAPDLPGFGSSDPFPDAVSMSSYADTIVEFLDTLGVESAVLVGNSMGGLLSIEAAVRHPERVRATVLACSGGIPLSTLRHRAVLIPGSLALNTMLRRRLIRRAALTRPVLRHALAARIVHQPQKIQPPHLVAALDGLGTRGFGRVLRAGLRYDARPRAQRVRCPTLIVWGRHDRLLPVWMGQQLHHLIGHSDFVVWEDTGHCPMVEHPERFNGLLETFVQQYGDSFGRSGSEAPPSGG
jgi:pimeloyl-ACP methyl ester carboxylesterase